MDNREDNSEIQEILQREIRLMRSALDISFEIKCALNAKLPELAKDLIEQKAEIIQELDLVIEKRLSLLEEIPTFEFEQIAALSEKLSSIEADYTKVLREKKSQVYIGVQNSLDLLNSLRKK